MDNPETTTARDTTTGDDTTTDDPETTLPLTDPTTGGDTTMDNPETTTPRDTTAEVDTTTDDPEMTPQPTDLTTGGDTTMSGSEATTTPSAKTTGGDITTADPETTPDPTDPTTGDDTTVIGPETTTSSVTPDRDSRECDPLPLIQGGSYIDCKNHYYSSNGVKGQRYLTECDIQCDDGFIDNTTKLTAGILCCGGPDCGKDENKWTYPDYKPVKQ